MTRKQCFLVCPPSGNMARKQCFLVCPPSGNMARKQFFLACLISKNVVREQCFLVCLISENVARKQCSSEPENSQPGLKSSVQSDFSFNRIPYSELRQWSLSKWLKQILCSANERCNYCFRI